eukprot:437285_1
METYTPTFKMVNLSLFDKATKMVLFGFMRESQRLLSVNDKSNNMIPLEIQYIIFCYYPNNTRNNRMLQMKTTDDALKKFYTLKFKNITAYLIFKCHAKKGIVDVEIEKLKSKCDSSMYLDQFVKDIFQSGQPRYGAVEWNKKICFVSWVPDSAKIRNKMVYAAARETFKDSLFGVRRSIFASNEDELNVSILKNKTKSITQN